MNFQIGDVVRLKSGGPEMTIMSSHAKVNGDWVCRWFDFRGSESFDHFHPSTIDLVHHATPPAPEPPSVCPECEGRGGWRNDEEDVWEDCYTCRGKTKESQLEPPKAPWSDLINRMQRKLAVATKLYAKARKITIEEATDNISDAVDINETDDFKPAPEPQPEPIGRTPGKWETSGPEVLGDDGQHIATCWNNDRITPEESEANAAWISQIPEIDPLLNRMASTTTWTIYDIDLWRKEINAILDAAKGVE